MKMMLNGGLLRRIKYHYAFFNGLTVIDKLIVYLMRKLAKFELGNLHLHVHVHV